MERELLAIQALLDNPATNPTAAALGFAIAGFAFVTVILAALAWALPGRRVIRRRIVRGPAPAQAAAKPRPRRRVRHLGLYVSAVLALAAVAVAYAGTSQDRYCTETCHAMTAPAEAWTASAHATVPCVRCHEGTFGAALVPAVSQRTRSLYYELTRAEGVAVTALPAERCLGCHGDVAQGVVVGGNGVAMAHEHVLAAGYACEDCHGAQGHVHAERSPTMASCLACHDGETASIDCDVCHRAASDKLIEVDDTRFGKLQLPETPTCSGCHSEEACDACHGLRMPHPPGYASPEAHAEPAAFRRKQTLCYRCHTFADCAECHEPFNKTHGDDWERAHATHPRDTTWCAGCHETADMCGLCHE